MYGMIHRAIYELLVDRHSEAEWERVKAHLRIDPEGMISTVVYPDEQTLKLIDEAAAILDISTPEFLQALGQYWITFAERSSYKYILDFTGSDLPSFIASLDRMHHAVLSAMPLANVPSFTLGASVPGEIYVDYRSYRHGLEPFVKGLLLGLITRFEYTGNVEFLGRFDGAARFAIRYSGSNGI